MSKPKNRLYRKSDGLVHSAHRGPRRRIDKLLAENASLLRTVQRESADVNRLNGFVAFLSGVIAEIEKVKTVEDARTFAIMAREHIDEFIACKWEPGPGDDAANWKESDHD